MHAESRRFAQLGGSLGGSAQASRILVFIITSAPLIRFYTTRVVYRDLTLYATAMLCLILGKVYNSVAQCDTACRASGRAASRVTLSYAIVNLAQDQA